MVFPILCLALWSIFQNGVFANTFHSLAELQAAEHAQRQIGERRLLKRNAPYEQWQPGVESKIQMILSGTLDMNATVPLTPESAEVFDIDLFDNNSTRIHALRAKGKKVICYFSAGTVEDWRPDVHKFPESATGRSLPMWPGERWLNIRDPAILSIMFQRIRYAWAIGCDAVDPDNLDGYGNEAGGGFSPSLKAQDAIRYLRNMAYVAHLYGIGIGLKNAEDILPEVQDVVDFVVNEECMTYNRTCSQYEAFVTGRPPLQPAKPVYHVEYVVRGTSGNAHSARKRYLWPSRAPQTRPRLHARDTSPVSSDSEGEVISNEAFSNLTSLELRRKYCIEDRPALASRMNTIIKTMDLDGWVMFCDGEASTTATIDRGTKEKFHPAFNNNTSDSDTGPALPPIIVPSNETERDAQENTVIEAALVLLPALTGISQREAEQQFIQNLPAAPKTAAASGAADESDAVAVTVSNVGDASATAATSDDASNKVRRADAGPLDARAILNAPFAPLPASYAAYNQETEALVVGFTARESRYGLKTYRGSAAKDVIPSKKWLKRQASRKYI